MPQNLWEWYLKGFEGAFWSYKSLSHTTVRNGVMLKQKKRNFPHVALGFGVSMSIFARKSVRTWQISQNLGLNFTKIDPKLYEN